MTVSLCFRRHPKIVDGLLDVGFIRANCKSKIGNDRHEVSAD